MRSRITWERCLRCGLPSEARAGRPTQWRYADEYPGCGIMLGDINHDGWMNNGDIDAFLASLTGR